jgi:hypothetical protein
MTLTDIDCRPLVKAGFAFKALKKWNGNEGIAFAANLYYKNKKVAEVSDYGWGSELAIHWMGLRYDGSIHTPSAAATHAAEAKAALDTIVAETPAVHSDGMDLTVNAGWMLDEFATAYMMAKDCKRKTMFRRPTDGKGTYAVINAKFDASMKAYIEKKHPGSMILNEVVDALFAA